MKGLPDGAFAEASVCDQCGVLIYLKGVQGVVTSLLRLQNDTQA
jgi:hypothetical protein